ncbi:hypothetical protein [Niveibacterium sp. SC-1]|uniref:hypothetical protein n=1 Tax=Niveibacterium sp. SC-1 TaxID=3135646 RepID=UPI00311ED800
MKAAATQPTATAKAAIEPVRHVAQAARLILTESVRVTFGIQVADARIVVFTCGAGMFRTRRTAFAGRAPSRVAPRPPPAHSVASPCALPGIVTDVFDMPVAGTVVLATPPRVSATVRIRRCAGGQDPTSRRLGEEWFGPGG